MKERVIALNIDLLKRLCETPGVPGREDRVRELIKSESEGLFDEITTDPMGSLICTRRARGSGGGSKAKRVLLLCHMDEIGFYVKHIDSKGFLRVQNAGGFDTRNLFARRVRISTREHGDIIGVMNPGGRPIHIATEEDKKKIPEMKEFIIDLGLPAEKVNEMIRVGDMVTIEEPFIEVGDKLVSKCLDNRLACWVGIEAVRGIEKAGVNHAADITVAFTVQEEVGLRGARTSSFGIEPDIAIGVDTTLACDTPGVPEDESVTVQGKGVGIGVMDGSMIADWRLIEDLEKVALANDIPVQRTILPRGGQDGGAAQMAASGCRAAALLVGLRNIHTVTEMADRVDVQAYRDLLTKWLPTVE